jgi:peroxiredoxin (alkyl hydroperoxide reductase subunit C)
MSETAKFGSVVPDFTMETYDPNKKDFGTFSLADARKKGKWTVLVFYPADYTFVCPTELADLARHQKALEGAGAVVVSVSKDTKFVHMAWQREEKLLKDVRYLMGADATGNVSRLFGVLDEESGLTFRGTFIISPEGKLVGSEVNYYNVGRSAEELARKMKANAYLVKHPEEACPANWTDGAKTLKPGADMVGRVAEALAAK